MHRASKALLALLALSIFLVRLRRSGSVYLQYEHRRACREFKEIESDMREKRGARLFATLTAGDSSTEVSYADFKSSTFNGVID